MNDVRCRWNKIRTMNILSHRCLSQYLKLHRLFHRLDTKQQCPILVAVQCCDMQCACEVLGHGATTLQHIYKLLGIYNWPYLYLYRYIWTRIWSSPSINGWNCTYTCRTDCLGSDDRGEGRRSVLGVRHGTLRGQPAVSLIWARRTIMYCSG